MMRFVSRITGLLWEIWCSGEKEKGKTKGLESADSYANCAESGLSSIQKGEIPCSCDVQGCGTGLARIL